jgi:hypothetical protein
VYGRNKFEKTGYQAESQQNGTKVEKLKNCNRILSIKPDVLDLLIENKTTFLSSS